MFSYDDDLANLILDQCRRRLSLNPVPIGLGSSAAPDAEVLSGLIRPEGNDPEVVLSVFSDELARSMLAADSPTYLAFIPHAPTPAARLFDMLISAASMCSSHWFESAGAILAENQTLRLLADLAEMPSTAGGCFVSGGSAGNLSALFVAREHHRDRFIDHNRRPRVMLSAETHASVALALNVIGVDAVEVRTDDHRLTGAGLAAALAAEPHPEDVIAVVATAGTTNAGLVDDLEGVADVARSANLWFHIDGAYGAAALFVPELRPLFNGIGRADSLVIDPHKWLFSPYDCGALLYREPALAKRVLTQKASYLDALTGGESDVWNPCDYAFHLTRRPRGLPLWFSLAVHGTDAYRSAIADTVDLARRCADLIERLPHLELVRQPELSVVLFRRTGWNAAAYQVWADRLFADQIALVAPTTWEGEPTARLGFLHPLTSFELVETVLGSMR